MAASANPSQLKYLLECSICLNRFHDPRVLPCLHSYCLECLESYISSNKSSDGTFSCPECREMCIPPEGGLDSFPKNVFVNSMKDVIPASPLQEQTKMTSLSAPVMCKYNSEESGSEHGTAVIFCAHFCHTCSKSHSLFDVTKYHTMISVNEATIGLQVKNSSNCKLHPNLAISWYCKTCSFPTCPECLIEKHKYHDTKKLSVIETAFKQDMLDVSTLASKRIEALQKIAADLGANKIKIEEDLDQTSDIISETADDLCKIVRQREYMLQRKVKQVREDTGKRFTKAEEALERAISNTSRLKSCAETIHQAPPELALCTALQPLVTKKQFMYQQHIPVPSIHWATEPATLERRHQKLLAAGFLGNIEVQTIQSKDSHKDIITLKAPINTTKLQYAGTQTVCGIAPIYQNMVCIAHNNEQYIWIYDAAGQLKDKTNIPGIDTMLGLVATDQVQGKLALVDGAQKKVHFVQLSHDLKIVQQSSTDVHIVAERIRMGSQRHLVVNNTAERTYAVLNTAGELLEAIDVLSISHTSIYLRCVVPTESGFVVCDRENKKVYFTDTKGHILHTSHDCVNPWPAVQTSWGHVLVPDSEDGHVKVFGKNSRFIGIIQDGNNHFPNLHHMHIDEGDSVYSLWEESVEKVCFEP